MIKSQYKSIGKNIQRRDVSGKIKGDSQFCADIELKDSISLKVLRSGRHHAVIENIDVAEAMKIPGVLKVFTARDIPGENLMGIINRDQPLLAHGKVRSKADPVALVAALTDDIALKALKAVDVTYTDLVPLLDIEDALAENAPKIHEKGNTLFTRRIIKGDAKTAFEDCHSIVEKQYKTLAIEHNYIEPDAGAGFVDEDGTLVIYASTQNPHYDHQEVVNMLGVEESRVRIIQAVTGGGFGSKLDLNVQGFIGLALYHLKRPVRYIYTREESYLATAKRHPFIIDMKTGTDKNGKLIAIKMRACCNTGAYGSYGIAVATRAAVHGTGPYQIEHVDLECSCVYTNLTFCGAMRGFGTPQAAFAHESQIDIHAQKLGIDPLEIRIINGLKKGSINGTGQKLTDSVGFHDCLKSVKPYYEKASKDWVKQKTSPFIKRGIGLGGMWYGIGNTGVQNPSTARIEIDLKGRVTLFTGCADIGQGSTTILSQIAAEVLGILPEQVRMVVGDTKLTANAGATSASRQTYISGNAVKDAAEKLASVLLTAGVNKLKVSKSMLEFKDHCIRVSGNPNKSVDFAWLAQRIHAKGGSLSWQGYFDPETIPFDPETGQGTPYSTYAFACQLAFVEADVLTGEVNVKKIVAAHDVGKAVHPENVIGQICGGIAMGVGFALMEEFEFGKTESMKDYHIPTCADMPEVIPIIVESDEPTGPFGAKGVGEPALIPTAPAILNALNNALGKRIYNLPANLERVLKASIESGHFSPK
ncbi:xanthine dehydrogenase family protein molybdopterin-binding subunit [Desulfococcaceae bacterium HSG9]|nr:xanthine dehydrogenase family protein molybdopterin-binding subunit [Desulfococcaceae bacterium HSG9]